MKPGYIPSPEEEEEAIQIILQFRAWVLGYPDPRERIPLPEPPPNAQDARRRAVRSGYRGMVRGQPAIRQ